MRKMIFGLDITLGILLLLIMTTHFNGCSAADIQRTQDGFSTAGSTALALAPAVQAAAPVLTVAASSLGWPAWVILILNIMSSSAAAIVASRKKTEIE